MTIKVQYPICYVQNMYISIHKVGVNGCGRLNVVRKRRDIMDSPPDLLHASVPILYQVLQILIQYLASNLLYLKQTIQQCFFSHRF
jgi:hypothetical protein